ncbi:MAG: polysaccharide biosynthesis protein [Cyclobacteriaceae bacterium]|nr:polysaccharide biosynthesis protein [Cyclobacteriaceae bacterium]
MKPHQKILIALFVTFFLHWNVFGQNQTEGMQSQDGINQMQNMTPAQLSTFNVDDLSDAQIKKYAEQAAGSGYSEAEIEMALKSRGMPQAQIDKLKVRMAKLQAGGVRSGTSFERARTRESNQIKEGELVDFLTKDYQEIKDEELKEKQERVFGFKLFNSETLTFEPNLNVPTPKGYVLGAGDEVIIDVWGASEQSYQQVISPEGNIIIPNIGPIYVSGLTVDRASERIISRLTQIYSGLSNRGGEPNTFAQVSLGQLRTIKIHVIGEAQRPGSFSVSSLATVAHALYLSGGPNYSGSMRNIEIIRDNEVFAAIDVYDFLINGVLSNNVVLKDGDIVRIKPYINRIEVNGEVKREGIYETIEGESFAKLIEYAGGFTENAYTELIKVRRNAQGEKAFLDLKLDELPTTATKNGDEVMVQGILTRYSNRVQIKGAVFREGEFELTEGMTVKQLIELAEGLRGDAFMERGLVYRTNEDFSYSVLSFNLRELIKGTADDVLLKREDLVQISSIYDLNDERYVLINGEVKQSGTYPFFQHMTVEDLIIRAGGLRESASGSKVEVARRIQDTNETETNRTADIFTFSINKNLELNGNDSKFELQPFDQVFIRRSPGYEPQVNVKLEGEVLYPGLYALKKKNERISEIIARAGGINKDGYPEGATLIRRTEFNPPKTIEQIRLENLAELLQAVEKNKNIEDHTLGSEAELLQQKRLQNVREELEAYNEIEDAGVGREGIRMKRERLDELVKRDSIELNTSELQFETIGINLEAILKNPGSKYDLILQDGDILSVPRQLQTVRMRGEFLYPITVRYDDGLSFRNYVSKAGGFSENARKKKAYILYANGSVDRTHSFLFFNNYPEVLPGAEIIVPQKPDRQPLSAQAWIAMSTSVATLALVIQQITR